MPTPRTPPTRAILDQLLRQRAALPPPPHKLVADCACYARGTREARAIYAAIQHAEMWLDAEAQGYAPHVVATMCAQSPIAAQWQIPASLMVKAREEAQAQVTTKTKRKSSC